MNLTSLQQLLGHKATTSSPYCVPVFLNHSLQELATSPNSS